MEYLLNSYLDFNATTPLQESAREAMIAAMDQLGNPSSVHRWGREARRLLETARRQIAGFSGAAASQIIFTSGGTEANALALSQAPQSRRAVSAIEHPSVLAHAAPEQWLAVRPDGVIDLEQLAQRLAAGGIDLISVMAANNETGVIQPLDDVIRLARAHDVRVHVDAVQALAKIPFDFQTLGADYVSLSAHKIGGPAGVGALLVRGGLDLTSLLAGGGQESRRRPGTENLIGITGFAAAVEGMARRDGWTENCRRLRDDLESGLRAIASDVVIFGEDAPRLANTSCFALAGLNAETQLMALDLAKVAISAGSACSSGKVAASHVLQAMGAPEPLTRAALRVSLGWSSQRRDVDRFLEAWQAHVAQVLCPL